MASEFIAHIAKQLNQDDLTKRITEVELPNAKNEAWKYTSLRQLSGEQYELTTDTEKLTSIPQDLEKTLKIQKRTKSIVFNNGQFFSIQGISQMRENYTSRLKTKL